MLRNTYNSIISELAKPTDSRIIFIVLDGLGGIPNLEFGCRTELEIANIPNLDELAKRSSCGLAEPISSFITPGSAPAHLALFGYSPIDYQLKRGVLEALGIGIELKTGEVAARANFAKIQEDNLVIDRRAGRIPTSENKRLCEEFLSDIEILGVKIRVYPAKEHRAVVIFSPTSEELLEDDVTDSDPGVTGEKIREIMPKNKESAFMAEVANSFQKKANFILKGANSQANGILLRGFSKVPNIPNFNQRYKLKSVCLADYPTYRGLAKLLGMDLTDIYSSIEEKISALSNIYKSYKYNFFFLHIKDMDRMGEDGDFEGRIKFLEEFDSYIPKILSTGAEVIVITGDHSTIPQQKSHSFHPTPILIYSKNSNFNPKLTSFSEREFQERGTLGKINSIEVLGLALAYASKLDRFGF